MNQHQYRRQLRKELLQLLAEQHRQNLAQELRGFVCSGQTAPAEEAVEAGAWSEHVVSLLSLLLPLCWRKLLIYALAIRKMARVFSSKA